MIKSIKNFDLLESHIKNSSLGYKDAIMNYYLNLGKKLGYTVRENAPVIRYGINIGKVDLLWLEPEVAFTSEFSSIDDLLRNLWKIIELKPMLAVIILSSKSNCKPGDVSQLIKNSMITKGMSDTFMLLDISEKKVVEIKD